MDYPNCFNLETILAATARTPGFFELGKERALQFTPLPKIGTSSLPLQVYLTDLLGNFQWPDKDHIHGFYRVQRLPRLAEGTFEVKLPESDLVVPLTHRRSYHPSAKFDEATWAKPENRVNVEYDEDTPGSIIKSLTNIDLAGRDICTTYSDLRVVIPAPQGWHEACEAFEHLYEGETVKHIASQRKLMDELMRKDVAPEAIVREFNEKDAAFAEQHRPVLDGFIDNYRVARNQSTSAVRRLLRVYSDAVGFTPLMHAFTKTTALVFDGQGRALYHDNLGDTRPVYSFDLVNSSNDVEKLPFNRRFHAELREKLLTEPTREKPYQTKAKDMLYESSLLLKDEHYAPAFLRAHAAFEVALKGFLADRGVLTDENVRQGNYPLSMMMGPIFDSAVTSDSSYRGRNRQIFDSTLRNAIMHGPQLSNGVPSLLDIRNAETHLGGVEGAHSQDEGIAHIGCVTYAEAVSYILHEGWKAKERVGLQSDILTWAHPYVQGHIPLVPHERAVHTLRQGLTRVLPYLDSREGNWLKQNVPSHSWAHKELQNYVPSE